MSKGVHVTCPCNNVHVTINVPGYGDIPPGYVMTIRHGDSTATVEKIGDGNEDTRKTCYPVD